MSCLCTGESQVVASTLAVNFKLIKKRRQISEWSNQIGAKTWEVPLRTEWTSGAASKQINKLNSIDLLSGPNPVPGRVVGQGPCVKAYPGSVNRLWGKRIWALPSHLFLERVHHSIHSDHSPWLRCPSDANQCVVWKFGSGVDLMYIHRSSIGHYFFLLANTNRVISGLRSSYFMTFPIKCN